MRRDLRAYLWDIDRAARDIQGFTQGKQLSDYQNDAMLRAAVERRFEVIGEALAQALRYYPAVVSRITHHQQIIAFRNSLSTGTPPSKTPWSGTSCKPICRCFSRRRLTCSAKSMEGKSGADLEVGIGRGYATC